MKTYISQSTERPDEWDKASSPDKVYHNRDITEVPASGDIPAMFAYTVDEYDRLEYLQHVSSATDERVVVVETTTDDLVLLMADLIGGEQK